VIRQAICNEWLIIFGRLFDEEIKEEADMKRTGPLESKSELHWLFYYRNECSTSVNFLPVEI
jgi:hypothetical protein